MENKQEINSNKFYQDKEGNAYRIILSQTMSDFELRVGLSKRCVDYIAVRVSEPHPWGYRLSDKHYKFNCFGEGIDGNELNLIVD